MLAYFLSFDLFKIILMAFRHSAFSAGERHLNQWSDYLHGGLLSTSS